MQTTYAYSPIFEVQLIFSLWEMWFYISETMLLCRPQKLSGHLSTVFLVDHVSVYSICCASNAGWVVAHS